MIKYKNWLMRLIPIACILVLTVGLSELFYQSLVRETTENCWDELSMARDDIILEVSNRLNINAKLLDLASDAIVMNANLEDADAMQTYLESVKKETIFDRIDVVFPNGTIFVSSTGERVMDHGEKAYSELVAKGTHISQRVPDFLTGQEALHVFSPIYDVAGQPVALLGATVFCSTLGDLFSSMHYGENAQLFLVDRRDGNLIIDRWHETPGSIYDMSGYEPSNQAEGGGVITEVMAAQTGRISYTSQLYGKNSYTIYGPVFGTEFSLIMVVQEDVVLADLGEMKSMLTWFGAIEVILLVLLMIWAYFIMRRSLKNEGRAQQAELELLQKKEQELESQYAVVTDRSEFLETMAINLPGGYHRCTTDHSFALTFISKSFTQITGYTMEQLQDELGCSYMGIVLPEDRDFFMSLAPQLESEGYIHCAYRIRCRDGSIRWVQDSTQYVEREGETYYQCALMDISERVEELERAKQEAEASSRAKSTFLFNISHDIRTPMNAIKGFSRIIEENAGNTALVSETIAKINQASDALMMLMNDVLDISRIERGKEEVNLRVVNLYEQGKNLYEMFAADMQAAGIHFVAEGDALHDHVYCDDLKLTRIMMNMLSNAKKFTPAGGTVSFGGTRLACDVKSCTYRFFVRDTGIGMSPEFQRRAFEQFERERTSTESGVTGSGLGLAIIKMLVELMGGTVEIQSELGKGTEITATLTFLLADQDQSQQTAQVQDEQDVSGKRILLVEDNDFNREIAKYILEGIGLAVEEAENGAVCIEKLMAVSAGFYDLILMDIQMPVMDGYTATTEIRNLADKQIATIPIVAMTANAFDEDKRKCMEVGMNGHIGKPIEMDALVKVLHEML